jgi:hypothetical protein
MAKGTGGFGYEVVSIDLRGTARRVNKVDWDAVAAALRSGNTVKVTGSTNPSSAYAAMRSREVAGVRTSKGADGVILWVQSDAATPTPADDEDALASLGADE